MGKARKALLNARMLVEKVREETRKAEEVKKKQ